MPFFVLRSTVLASRRSAPKVNELPWRRVRHTIVACSACSNIASASAPSGTPSVGSSSSGLVISPRWSGRPSLPQRSPSPSCRSCVAPSIGGGRTAFGSAEGSSRCARRRDGSRSARLLAPSARPVVDRSRTAFAALGLLDHGVRARCSIHRSTRRRTKEVASLSVSGFVGPGPRIAACRASSPLAL